MDLKNGSKRAVSYFAISSLPWRTPWDHYCQTCLIHKVIPFFVVRRFLEASLEMMVWRDTWEKKGSDSKKWWMTHKWVILSCLFCRLFLRMKTGVENCYTFPNVPQSPQYSSLSDLQDDAKVLLNLDLCKWPQFPGTLWPRRHHLRSAKSGGYPIGSWQLLWPRLGNCIIKDDKWQSWRTRGEIGRWSWNMVMPRCNSTWIGFSNSVCRNFWCIWCQIIEFHLQEGEIVKIYSYCKEKLVRKLMKFMLMFNRSIIWDIL